jgi:hypothetical protein
MSSGRARCAGAGAVSPGRQGAWARIPTNPRSARPSEPERGIRTNPSAAEIKEPGRGDRPDEPEGAASDRTRFAAGLHKRTQRVAAFPDRKPRGAHPNEPEGGGMLKNSFRRNCTNEPVQTNPNAAGSEGSETGGGISQTNPGAARCTRTRASRILE